MQIIKKSDWKTTNWSGGTTSELFIFPEGSSFKSNDYEVRISLATVESEESSFTALPGIQRTLMVLEGTQLINHEERHTAELNQFEQDTFSGNWKTSCKGTSINFNVMCQDDQFVRVQSIPVLERMKGTLTFNDTFVFIYIKDGSVKINGTTLTAGQSVVLTEAITLEGLEDSILIEVVF
jgi:environmental stress-induced protein Ves